MCISILACIYYFSFLFPSPTNTMSSGSPGKMQIFKARRRGLESGTFSAHKCLRACMARNWGCALLLHFFPSLAHPTCCSSQCGSPNREPATAASHAVARRDPWTCPPLRCCLSNDNPPTMASHAVAHREPAISRRQSVSPVAASRTETPAPLLEPAHPLRPSQPQPLPATCRSPVIPTPAIT